MKGSATILGCAGLGLTQAERRFFADVQPWGFILFARNIKDAAQVTALTSELRGVVGWNAPILIDQEGGRVQRLRGPIWREWLPPLDQMGRAKTVEDAAAAMRLRYRLIAHELRAVGIDVNCAPTADVARPETHPFLRNRLYGNDPDVVATVAREVAAGLLSGGVLPVIKHMPGHGAGMADSHTDLPHVDLDSETLDKIDFAAFRDLADLPLGMTAHVVFAAFGSSLPATLDAGMIRLLRDEIGFDGALMTDDLSMGALPGGIGERAARARAAGVDLILHCNGDRGEMEDAVANAGTLDGDARRRTDAAIACRTSPDPLDIDAVEAELSDLLNGEVYVSTGA